MMVLGKSGDALQYQICESIADAVTTAQATAAQTIDWSTASLFPLTLGYNTTFTFTNARIGQRVTLVLTQDGSGNKTGTFPATCKFVGGSKTLTTTASGVDTVEILCITPTLYLCSLLKAYA